MPRPAATVRLRWLPAGSMRSGVSAPSCEDPDVATKRVLRTADPPDSSACVDAIAPQLAVRLKYQSNSISEAS
ncbi:hypothetical protein GCM10010493_34770 [Streptomyces lavendulae subsp. grasserius]